MPQALGSATYDVVNQLTQRAGVSFTYEENGNLTSDGTNTYNWNARNQLASMTGPGLTASFQYDSSGKRINKTINGTSTTYLHDGDNVVQELSGTTPTANLLNGGVDKVFTRADSSGARTPLSDGLGSTLALADDAGTLQTEYTYDPFGNTTSTGTTSTNSSKYTGREEDGTGLYYYRARYYSPSLQRFISEDPIGFGGGDANLYAYVGNDPINFADPSGLCGELSQNTGFLMGRFGFSQSELGRLARAFERINSENCHRFFDDTLANLRRRGEIAPQSRFTPSTLQGVLNITTLNRYSPGLTARQVGVSERSWANVQSRFANTQDGVYANAVTLADGRVFLGDNAFYISGPIEGFFGVNSADLSGIIIHEFFHRAGLNEAQVQALRNGIQLNCGIPGYAL